MTRGRVDPLFEIVQYNSEEELRIRLSREESEQQVNKPSTKGTPLQLLPSCIRGL